MDIEQPDNLLGLWQLEATFFGLSNGNQWNAIENGYIYQFKEDETFYSNKFSECSTGDYILTNNTLTLVYNCEDFSTALGDPPATFVEYYNFEDGFLLLSPAYLNCDEGCLYKFKRLE